MCQRFEQIIYTDSEENNRNNCFSSSTLIVKFILSAELAAYDKIKNNYAHKRFSWLDDRKCVQPVTSSNPTIHKSKLQSMNFDMLDDWLVGWRLMAHSAQNRLYRA